MTASLGATTYTSVTWTAGDTITEAKLDNMVANDQAYDSHSAQGLLLDNNKSFAGKNNAGSTNQNLIKIDASDNVVVGDGNLNVQKASSVIVQVLDGAISMSTGDGKAYITIPQELNGMNLVGVHAKVITAGTTSTCNIMVRNVTQTADMLSTAITIDSAELGSDTAATPAVIDTANDDVATNDTIAIDVDAVHTTPAKGLIVRLRFALP